MDEGQRKNLSVGLSALLRHNNRGVLEIDREGWADLSIVTSILATGGRAKSVGLPVDASVVEKLVAGDEKGRFEIHEDGKRIRATSGHSFEVDLGLVPFTPDGPLWFGTVVNKADDIERDGLRNSTKLKTRLVRSRERAEEIAVARGCDGPLVIEIDATALAAAGYELGIGPSGEVLVDRFGPEFIVEFHRPGAAPTP